MTPNLKESFWKRNDLREEERDVCLEAIRDVYPGCAVEELNEQGYCSFTVSVTKPTRSLIEEDATIEDCSRSTSQEPLIVQIRPQAHTLDLQIGTAATHIYGIYAPEVRSIECRFPPGLQAVEMQRLPGVPLSSCKMGNIIFREDFWEKRVALVQSFASLIALSWPSAPTSPPVRQKERADSPVESDPATSTSIAYENILSQCTGKVGTRIMSKLEKLSQELPDAVLRQHAAQTLLRSHELNDLPIVLNHGDLISSNILIDPYTWRITGIVDWAEAEWLPFGTCLYGLELLLGHLCYHDSSASSPAFEYYDNAPRLRALFWERLVLERPDVKLWKDQVKLARDVGVLLWYGFAWDEGRIDRVVNEKDDVIELECLKSFLGVGLVV